MIPNIFHFIYFYPDKTKSFPLIHLLTVNSARILNNPEKIYFYSDKIPEGLYWDKISDFVEFVKTDPPESIFGNNLHHIAHKSDVLRLQILLEKGGIYTDMDIIFKKPFTHLLKHDFVMGKQGKFRKMGLCNGVVMADKDSGFLKIWFEEFRNFRSMGKDKYWDEMSVKKPLELSVKHPDLIHVEPYDSFHYPLYYGFHLKKLFKKNLDFPNALCHHYWDGASYEKYLKNITEEYIKNVDTTFNAIARKYLI